MSYWMVLASVYVGVNRQNKSSKRRVFVSVMVVRICLCRESVKKRFEFSLNLTSLKKNYPHVNLIGLLLITEDEDVFIYNQAANA